MATAPSLGYSYDEATNTVDHTDVIFQDVGIFFSENANVGDYYNEPIMRVWFHIGTLSPSLQPPLITGVDLTMSQLALLRAAIPNEILGRPDVYDVGGFSEFLANSVASYAHAFVLRFFYSDALAGYGQSLRVEMIEFIVSIFMVETQVPRQPQPQLKKVEYEEKGEGSSTLHETACAICLEDFVRGEEVDLTPCRHPLHPSCLGHWLERKPSCPLCRNLLPFHANSD